MIELEDKTEQRIEQGDIYSNIKIIENINSLPQNRIEIFEIYFPYVVVLTQDCDLLEYSTYFKEDPEYKDDDKKLFSIIVAPMYPVDLFLEGKHLSHISINYQMRVISKLNKKNKPSTVYKNLIANEIPRYHYLEFLRSSPIPDLIIDFKHFFTINASELRENMNEKFECKIRPLYRESISQRFAYFLSRIGLPSINDPKSK